MKVGKIKLMIYGNMYRADLPAFGLFRCVIKVLGLRRNSNQKTVSSCSGGTFGIIVSTSIAK